MTDAETAAIDLIARFEQAADAAREAEDAYRREAAGRIEALAQARSRAFRRLNLLRQASTTLATAEEPSEAIARARLTVAQSLGWDEIGPRQELVLTQLTPVLEALQAAMDDDRNNPDAVEEALVAFEDWYGAETGSDFYALFDRYMPETPRVDF
ncbi:MULTISPECIES: hypothetical protein [Bosea]|uniref:hypothetical protein n=1 Tax=Bosea TaxID=85413 RepID=UPI00215025BA|nr:MULTISPECIES: hypothetical protein [Bosea]MCR4522620.1 hypothetical protein [Bosea sp. 47.2.35]MDR6827127.1 hypothetical protein [Bosea robiniae]MDR6893837.1 hypothetical protein [Bosea sp. BE109]MDR7136463.1 hypothetical protein [Bosea sp. BE168]MDR7173162.1 hypothetical protein [Bosea sp. BE271]